MNTEQRYNKDFINFLENKNYQKTAIGYIQYLYDYRPEYNLIEEDFIFAKQMEKEQIINAHINGYDSSGGCANEYLTKNMENNKTAVEWLKDMLEWNYGNTQMLKIEWKNLDDLIKRAKQMEKKQMKKIAEYWHYNGIPDEHFEEYYKEKYNQ